MSGSSATTFALLIGSSLGSRGLASTDQTNGIAPVGVDHDEEPVESSSPYRDRAWLILRLDRIGNGGRERIIEDRWRPPRKRPHGDRRSWWPSRGPTRTALPEATAAACSRWSVDAAARLRRSSTGGDEQCAVSSHAMLDGCSGERNGSLQTPLPG